MNKKQHTTKIISALVVVVFVVSIFQITPQISEATDSSMSDLYSNPNQSNGKNPYKFKVSDVVNSNLLTQVVGCTGVVNKVSTWMTKFIQSPAQQTKMTAEKIEKYRDLLKAACATGKAATQTATGSTPTASDTTSGPTTLIEKIKTCAQNVDDMKDADVKAQMEANEKDAERDLKDQCFDGIAITLAKNQLTAMTRSAVNWVNSGYGGNPFFVQNMTNFTNRLERNVLETGIDVLLTPDYASPYARNFAMSTINSYRSGGGIGSSPTNFLGNLQSDLGAFITDPKSYYTDEQLGGAGDTRTAFQRAQDVNYAFSNDFSTGGWDGWLALTQRDQNNPLGFTMLASQQLADRQEQQVTNTRNELTQNNGFLSQKTCTKWQIYDESGNAKISQAYKNWQKDSLNSSLMGPVPTMPEMFEYSNTKPRVCYKAGGECCVDWEIITPGSIIKDKTTSYLNSPERQLELADTINESLNALFSILISKLEGSGLTGLSDSAVTTNWTDDVNGGWTNLSSDPYNNNGAYNNFNLTRDLGNTYFHGKTYKVGNWNASSNTTDSEKNPKLYPDLAPEYYDGNGNLITANTYFTVSVPGNSELVKEGYNGWVVGDRAFWDGEAWQNWRKGQTSPLKKRGVIQIQQDYIVAAKEILKVLPKVMPSLGELDYCIPGPNPSYKTNSSDAQSAYQDWVGSMYVGILGSSGERYGVKIDNVGDPAYDNLQNIYSDNTNVWKTIKDTFHFNYLINEFSNICNSYSLVGGIIHPWNRPNCTGSYFYAKNSDLSEDDSNHLGEKMEIMNLNQNYVNSHMFQNFYEVFDNMMDKLYFKNITSMYTETENKFLNTDTDKNSGYIPMVESGLDLTKNMLYYNEDITKAIGEYTDAISQAKVNISKLEPIKAEVSKIIKDAQDRRDAKLLENLNKMNTLAIETCKAEQVECDNQTENVPQCLIEYNNCIEENVKNGGIMTEAQYKARYAECFDEEDIQFFDVEEIMNAGNIEEERCSNGIDDDLDRLIDRKDPDCKDNNVVTPPESKHCVLGISTTNTQGYPNNKKCSLRLTEIECENTGYYHGTLANECDWTTGPGIVPPTTSQYGCKLGGGKWLPDNGLENKNCLFRTKDECELTKYINDSGMSHLCEFDENW